MKNRHYLRLAESKLLVFCLDTHMKYVQWFLLEVSERGSKSEDGAQNHTIKVLPIFSMHHTSNTSKKGWGLNHMLESWQDGWCIHFIINNKIINCMTSVQRQLNTECLALVQCRVCQLMLHYIKLSSHFMQDSREYSYPQES